MLRYKGMQKMRNLCGWCTHWWTGYERIQGSDLEKLIQGSDNRPVQGFDSSSDYELFLSEDEEGFSCLVLELKDVTRF